MHDILNEIGQKGSEGAPHDFVRQKHLKALADETGRDTILYAADLSAGYNVGSNFINEEDILAFKTATEELNSRELDLILHSPGGFGDAAEQIVNFLRSRYEHIRAIIPQTAMSAATMIACAADEILMGDYSALGPTDVQIGPGISAQHVLSEFELAKEEMAKDPRSRFPWSIRLNSIPQGYLEACSKQMELARTLVSQWLEKYMFKDTPQAKARADHIATWLANAEIHKSHSRPLAIGDLVEQGLKVRNLKETPNLEEKVFNTFTATVICFDRSPYTKITENHKGKVLYAMPRQGS